LGNYFLKNFGTNFFL
ncbi:DNA topoisomerase family protein, partial [Chlamydia psittaci 06-1683]